MLYSLICFFMTKINKNLNLFLIASLVFIGGSKLSLADNNSNISDINSIIQQQNAYQNQINNYNQQQVINNQQTIIQEQQKLIENLKQSNNTNNSHQNNQQNQQLTQQSNQIQNNNQTTENTNNNNNTYVNNNKNVAQGIWSTHLAPIVYYNTLRSSLDIGGNFYFEYRKGIASIVFGIYGVYNGVYGNNWQNWHSPNYGETGKFASLFSIAGDIGFKISGTNAYGSFVFGFGGGMTKFNVSNTALGGGYKGTKGMAKLHFGVEFGYKRFFTRLDVLFGLSDVKYIDDYGVSHKYSQHRSRCSSSRRGSYYCNTTDSQVDLLLGVGMYLF